MNRIFLLTGVVFMSICASAKEHTSTPSRRTGRLAVSHPAQRTTGAQERLIGFSYRQLNSTAVLDTAIYYYSSDRGSEPIDFISDIVPYVDAPNHQNLKCDSFVAKLMGYQSGIFQYNAQNEAIEFTLKDTAGSPSHTLRLNDHRYFYYNAADHIANDSEFYNPYNSAYKTYHIYDASGFITRDSQQNCTANLPADVTDYVNDAHGNHLQSTYYVVTFYMGNYVYKATEHTINTYDAYDHLTSDVIQVNDGGTSWTDSLRDTMFYPGSSDRYTRMESYQSFSGTWYGTTAKSLHVNAANQWDTVYYYDWNTGTNTFDLSEKDFQVYDTYGNLLYTGGLQYISASAGYAAAPYDRNSYYYETYYPAAVNNAPAVSVSVSIYPNPVSQVLYVSMQGVPAQHKGKVSVTNMTGQTVSTAAITGTDISCINMASLAPGMYVVSVSGEGVSYTQKIVKAE